MCCNALQVCQSAPRHLEVCQPRSTARVDEMAAASAAVSGTSTSTGNSGTSERGWDLEPRTPPLDAGWVKGWSPVASPAREGPARGGTATRRDIAHLPAPATRAGRDRFATSRSTTPAMATSESGHLLNRQHFCFISRTSFDHIALRNQCLIEARASQTLHG